MSDDATLTNPAQTPTYAAAPEAVSPEQSGESAPGASWFDALTGREPAGPEELRDEPTFEQDGAEPQEAYAAGGASGAQGSEDDGSGTEASAPPPPRKTEPGPDDVVRMTRTQYERKVQSEVDRILAKQQRETQRRQQQESARAQQQALLSKAEQDPVGFSDDFLARERQQQDLQERTAPIYQAIADSVKQWDQAIVTPVMRTLPHEVAARLHAEIQPVGVEGRSKLVGAALQEIRKAERTAGRAEGEKRAEAKLRKSAAFRKELLAELRGSEDEPELLPGNGASPQTTDMDDWIRQVANARLS